MALFSGEFGSVVLGKDTALTVALPPRPGSFGSPNIPSPEHGFPTLYLLHGFGGTDTAWIRMSSIERYAADYGVAVVMPDCERSFYANEAHGLPYWTYLSEELPAVVGSYFGLSTRREDTFVAGCSMGGYGAFAWALRHPERFAAAASLSGCLDLAKIDDNPDDAALVTRVFGGPLSGTEHDLVNQLGSVTADNLPALYQACGTDDFLFAANREFHKVATERGIDVTTDFGPGEHDWEYFDSKIRDVLAWLPLRPS